jgi:hypothetical protein
VKGRVEAAKANPTQPRPRAPLAFIHSTLSMMAILTDGHAHCCWPLLSLFVPLLKYWRCDALAAGRALTHAILYLCDRSCKHTSLLFAITWCASMFYVCVYFCICKRTSGVLFHLRIALCPCMLLAFYCFPSYMHFGWKSNGDLPGQIMTIKWMEIKEREIMRSWSEGWLHRTHQDRVCIWDVCF